MPRGNVGGNNSSDSDGSSAGGGNRGGMSPGERNARGGSPTSGSDTSEHGPDKDVGRTGYGKQNTGSGVGPTATEKAAGLKEGIVGRDTGDMNDHRSPTQAERDEIGEAYQSTAASAFTALSNVVTSYLGVTNQPTVTGKPNELSPATRTSWGPGTMLGAWSGIPGASLAGGWVDAKLGTETDLTDKVTHSTSQAPKAGTGATGGLLTASASSPTRFGVTQLDTPSASRVAQPGNYAVSRGLLKA